MNCVCLVVRDDVSKITCLKAIYTLSSHRPSGWLFLVGQLEQCEWTMGFGAVQCAHTGIVMKVQLYTSILLLHLSAVGAYYWTVNSLLMNIHDFVIMIL